MGKKGKYAGECPECNLVLMKHEDFCVRCGAKFKPAEQKKFIQSNIEKDDFQYDETEDEVFEKDN